MATQPRRTVEVEEDDVPNFSSLLDTPSEDVERPKPGPMGHYLAMVKGHAVPTKSKQQTPGWIFTFQPLEAGDDVDANDLKAWLTKANGDVVPLRDKSFTYTLWESENALYRITEFLDDLGIPSRDESNKKLTVRQRMQEAPGKTCYIQIVHNPSTRDGVTMYANVGRTLPVKDE